MPQAIDLASLTRKASATPRKSSSPEPTGRFDDVLNKQTRRADQEESPKEAKRSDEVKPSRKTEKKSKPEAEAPAEEVEAAEPQEQAAEPAPVEESSEEPATEGDSSEAESDEQSETKEPVAETTGEVDPELLAAMAQQAQQSAVSTDDTVETGDAGEVVDGVDALATAVKGAQPKPVDPSAATAAAPEESTEGEGELGAALAIPKEAQTDSDETLDLPKMPEFAKPAASADNASDDLRADFAQQLQTAEAPKPAAGPQAASGPQPIPIAPERQFADDNVDRIVSTVKSQISPTGGSMKIRLDPPHMGTLDVDITVDDGVLTASFQTNNDEATRLLSHSMQHLKNSLETAGVSVDRIQVKQAAPSEQSSSNNKEDQQQQQNPQDHPARQEQQRREMLQKMWRKLALGEEPLDLVA